MEEAFFSLARDIKKRLIDSPQDLKVGGNAVDVSKQQDVKSGGCC